MPRSSSFTIILLTTLCFIVLWFYARADDCTKYSGKSCEDCVEVSGCSYCKPTKVCQSGSLVKKTLQISCEGQKWMSDQCVVSGRVVIILSVTGVEVLIVAACCIYCCCCRKRRDSRSSEGSAKWRRQREEIRIKYAKRSAERQKKRDAIREKYGDYNCLILTPIVPVVFG